MTVTDDDLTRWQLDEHSAAAYEQYLVPTIFAPAAEGILEALAPQPGERLLDVACGTGVVARQAAPRVAPGGRVCGLDLNDAMLDVARAASAETEIDWRQGDAAAMPLPDAAFDVVVCQAALMFMPDPAAALGEMRRVLAPGGRLGLSVFRDGRFNPLYAAFAELLERHVGRRRGNHDALAVRGVGGGRPARTARRRRPARGPDPHRVRRRALPVRRRDAAP